MVKAKTPVKAQQADVVMEAEQPRAASTDKAAKPARTKPEGDKPKVVAAKTPLVAGAEMKKKELIDLVVTRGKIKKKEARQSVDAVLAVLGEALGAGRELNLQPMGRIKITRVKEAGNGSILTCRIRRGGAGGAEEGDAKDPLAEAED